CYRQGPARPVPEGGPRPADPRDGVPAVEQRHRRAGGASARRRPRRPRWLVAVRHRRARPRFPEGHRAGVAPAHRRARAHHRHEPLRNDVLSPGGASCVPRDPRARHVEPLRRLRLLRRAQGHSRSARRARLLVLALRGWGVGGGVHRRVRGRSMRPAVEIIASALPRSRYQVASDLVALTKPRVLLMVLATTLVGYVVALTGPADYLRLAHL